jgi:uncharacterized protein
MTIPRQAYDWLDKDYETLTLSIAMIAREDLDDQHAYNIAKALVEKNDIFRAVHPFLKPVVPQYLTSLQIGAYHPGAVRYYREKGLMK